MLDVVLASVVALLVVADILIADYGWRLPLYHSLQRPHEERGLHAATLAMISCIVAYKLFALPVALAAIAMLVYGDAAAAIAGLLSGTCRKKRAFPRIASMFLISCVLGCFILGWIGVSMAVVAVIAECLVIRVDDAVTIPLFSGLAGQLLWFLLQ
jgi:dolichol kinase